MNEKLRKVACGPVTLQLAGIPAQHRDNLLLALLNQIHIQTNVYHEPPDILFRQLKQSIEKHLDDCSINHPLPLHDLLQVICDCFGITIIIYFNNDRLIYNPPSTSIFTANLYQYQNYFDSVVNIFPKHIINDPVPRNSHAFVKMITWNVRGASDDVKRVMIDSELTSDKCMLAAIQESHLWSSYLTTSNFKWTLGPQVQSRASRGVGFLVHRNFVPYVTQISFPTPNIGVLCFQLPFMKLPFYLINVHKLSNGNINSSIETGTLSTQIQRCLSSGHTLIVGDMNCHFGYKDENIKKSKKFGNILFHDTTNSNGEDIYMLCELLDLEVVTTIFHRSTKITWSSNTNSSQIDHILKPRNANFNLFSLQGCWTKLSTDHKKLSWSVKIPLSESKKEYFKFPSFSSYHFKSWNLKILSDPNLDLKNDYESMIEACIREQLDSSSFLTWNELSSIACFCAEHLLKNKKNDMSEDQKLAFLNYQAALKTVMSKRMVDKNPNLVDSDLDVPVPATYGSIKVLRDAHKALVKSRNDKPKEALKSFLQHLETQSPIPGQRVQAAYDYLRCAKRFSTQLCSSQISIKNWNDELNKIAGNKLELLPEDDFNVILPPPCYNDVLAIVKSMKNNKTPGLDNVCVEMLKASPTLCYHLFKLIRNAYLNNEVPIEWQETYTVPIPKVKSPKDVNDYRKLTMCSVGYKVYSALLMKMLQIYLPPLDFYQYGFTKNRSTDDLCFVLKNVLDYRWNVGRTTFIFSLDLQKAFDTVKISTLPEILLSYNVPKYLVNRVISTVLTEYNSIYWKGEYTRKITKAVGIKQGCKVSPEFFIYILNQVVAKTKDDLRLLGINLCIGKIDEDLQLPLFLAYADDCYLLCEDVNDGLKICDVLIHHLNYYGLSLNFSKSKILIKGSMDFMPPHYTFHNHMIPVVTTLKVLGTFVNSDMHRKSTLKPRVLSTIKLFRGLLPYLKNLKAPIELLMKLYVTIIVPSLIYGLSSSSMTKQNASTLMRREIFTIKELANIAHPRPSQTTIAKLLENKTINRKVSVGRIRYYYHVKRSATGSLILKSLNYNENLPRRVGRPLFTFNDSLKRDLLKFLDLGITQSDMDGDYELRDVIKKLTSQLYLKSDLSDDPLPIDLNLYTESEL